MTNRLAALATSLVLALVAVPAAAADKLVPHTAVYKVRISIASGTLTTVVQESGDGFQVQSVIQPTGFAGLFFNGTIEENSQFATDDDGVRPLVYWSKDGLSSDPKVMHFVFDYDKDEVSGTVNDERYRYPLEKEVHDRVSIQYELMHNLVTGMAGSDYALLDDDELKEIAVTAIGSKRVKVPHGSYDAVGIRHAPPDSKRETTLWCAPELGYLPVLIEQTRKGKTQVRAELSEYRPGMPGESAVSASN